MVRLGWWFVSFGFVCGGRLVLVRTLRVRLYVRLRRGVVSGLASLELVASPSDRFREQIGCVVDSWQSKVVDFLPLKSQKVSGIQLVLLVSISFPISGGYYNCKKIIPNRNPINYYPNLVPCLP